LRTAAAARYASCHSGATATAADRERNTPGWDVGTAPSLSAEPELKVRECIATAYPRATAV
jgi:hypothetical protein